MAEILFVTWDGGGNLPPALGIGAELAARGHRVRFLGHTGQQQQVAGAGFDFTAFPTARRFSAAAPGTPVDSVHVFGDRAMGADVVQELRSRPADLLVVDCLLFGAMEAARREGVPYVVLEHLYDAYLRGGLLRGPVGLGLRLKRFRPVDLLDGAQMCLVASLPELDPVRRRAANVVHTGPVVTGTSAAPEEPTVLVSLSTYAFRGQQQVLQHVVDGLAGLPVRTVVTTGPQVDPESLRAPASTEVHAYVPHPQLMPRASMVVGHGGHATTMVALAHDLPLLVLPLHPFLDQPMVGRSVRDAGAGRVLGKRSSPDRIRQAAEQLLGAGPHRAAAAQLGARIREGRGPAAAADRLEGLVGSGTRHR